MNFLPSAPPRSLRLPVMLAALLASPAVPALTATTTFNVTATVLKACAMSTPGTLAFGTYVPAGGNTATTSFTVTCTFGTPYSVGLSPGTAVGATVTARAMTSASASAGNNTLNYGLYKDVALGTNWDNSASGTGYTGNGAAQTLTIYGAIPAGQYGAAPASDYLDTITVTLTY